MSERLRSLEAETMCEAFQTTVAEHGEKPALKMKGSEFEASWSEYGETVRRRAAGLAALGVGRGDTVGFMLVNRPALHLTDTAAMHLGATTFSIYNTSSAEQIEYLIEDAANRVIVTEVQFLEAVLAARERVETLEQVVVVDGTGRIESTITLAELDEMGAEDFDFDAAWQAVEPEDVLCLIYTSGTTGPPKGVQLTHANMVAQWRSCDQVHAGSVCGRQISFLPSAHVADRWACLYAQMFYGTCVYCCPDVREMVAYTMEVRPTVWGGVPRIFEKLKLALEIGVENEPNSRKKKDTEAALAIGKRWVAAYMEGEIPDELQAEWDKADALVFSGIRQLLGLEQVEWFAVGAAPTPPEVIEFFLAIGIEICEVWGMSETTSPATVNPPGRIRVGTVGPPMPGVEVKLAEDGWLLSGDVGEFDEEGYLRIVDRKKELIINAAGKNMSPANIEAKLKAASPLIGQAVAIGDARPYNVALIVPDPEALAARGAEADDPVIVGEIAGAVEAANQRLSRVEQIKYHAVLDGEWAPGGDELTPTMKLKRRPIERKYAERIEALYAPQPE
jgi:long-subunit acyl-CoA synthetase (AMP-forming)